MSGNVAEPGRTSRRDDRAVSLAALHAEPELFDALARIDCGVAAGIGNPPVEMEQLRADMLLARVAWSRIAEPGDGTAGTLLAAFGAPVSLEMLVRGTSAKQLRAALAAEGAELSTRAVGDALARWLPRLDRSETLGDIERAGASGVGVVLPGDPDWPVLLDDLGMHAPTMLWVRGDARMLKLPALSVVGARAATGYGSHVTAEIVDGVCASGLTVVSGAAYGIDAVAHRTALAAGAPTVAVLAGGVDRPYPRAHEALLDRIAGVGTVCAEMVPGSAPTKWRFLQRNRLIAALSGATLVTEAGIRSGSLNTAGHAAQLGRMLGAVPGPVTSAASAGCHKLIREYDATLVTNAREACELAGVHDPLAPLETDAEEGRELPWERRVLDALPLRGARGLIELSKRSGLTPEQVRGVLAELELLGRVRKQDPSGGAPTEWALLRPQ